MSRLEASQAMLHVLEATQGSLVQKTNARDGCNQQLLLTKGQSTSDNACDWSESLCVEVLL